MTDDERDPLEAAGAALAEARDAIRRASEHLAEARIQRRDAAPTRDELVCNAHTSDQERN